MLKVGKTTHRIDGKVVSEQEFIRRSRARRGGERIKKRSLATWPLTPETIAINPEHIASTMEVDKKHGVPTEYTPEGMPIITGPKHYRDYCRLHEYGMFNGGYGDPQFYNR